MPERISPEVEELARRHVGGEAFPSTNDVLLAALRLFDQYRKYEHLRSDVKSGFDEIERGDGVEIEHEAALRAFFDEVKRRGRQRLSASQS